MKRQRVIYLLLGIVLFFSGLFGLFLYYSYSSPFRFREGTGMMGRGMGGMMSMDMRMMERMMRNMEEIERKMDFSSIGERIYFRGTDSKGEFIKNSHGMKGVGCARCHGSDALGMEMMMVEVPPLKWSYLTDPGGHTHPGGRTHPPFTEPSFKSCILGGVDPAGNPLNTMMPKWEMSSEDLDSLIEYLKTI